MKTHIDKSVKKGVKYGYHEFLDTFVRGKRISDIRVNKYGWAIAQLSNSLSLAFHHEQDCCEQVKVVDQYFDVRKFGGIQSIVFLRTRSDTFRGTRLSNVSSIHRNYWSLVSIKGYGVDNVITIPFACSVAEQCGNDYIKMSAFTHYAGNIYRNEIYKSMIDIVEWREV